MIIYHSEKLKNVIQVVDFESKNDGKFSDYRMPLVNDQIQF